jgi:hypothetical protein
LHVNDATWRPSRDLLAAPEKGGGPANALMF